MFEPATFCTMATVGPFPGLKSSCGVTLITHPHMTTEIPDACRID
jgi:hypothetical protein